MAAVGSPFNGMLFRMDFGQSSDSFYQSASLQSPMDNPFLSANMNNDNPVNPAPMGSSVNFDNTYYNKYSLCNSSPSLIGGGLTPFMRNALLSANSESGVGYFASCSGFSHSTRNKHKREEDITECPLKKRRISEHAKVSVFPEPTACHSSADILKGEISRSCWDSNCKAEITAAIQYSESDVLSEMHLAQSEEMEEASSEFFSPACGNDHRLSSANEELETDKKADCLPSLILSDVLKEGLKRGFEESLTKKIVDSISVLASSMTRTMRSREQRFSTPIHLRQKSGFWRPMTNVYSSIFAGLVGLLGLKHSLDMWACSGEVSLVGESI
ncbi:uncharacterized protein LOC108707184 isoform X2 [Xenopus laevis]|uniref:Uncharacterized protein LOC108707184 isoform X2 n=1 Tax=Xenopus laevis TaxID=8355 RepID=A0A8J1M4X2_XENLA|nr:uncharacterized protein LOC108707184 isoform X2 [Xenopus laevis]